MDHVHNVITTSTCPASPPTAPPVWGRPVGLAAWLAAWLGWPDRQMAGCLKRPRRRADARPPGCLAARLTPWPPLPTLHHAPRARIFATQVVQKRVSLRTLGVT